MKERERERESYESESSPREREISERPPRLRGSGSLVVLTWSRRSASRHAPQAAPAHVWARVRHMGQVRVSAISGCKSHTRSESAISACWPRGACLRVGDHGDLCLLLWLSLWLSLAPPLAHSLAPSGSSGSLSGSHSGSSSGFLSGPISSLPLSSPAKLH